MGMCGQSTAYNTYATLPYTNPLFMGFSGYLNVNKSLGIYEISIPVCRDDMKIDNFLKYVESIISFTQVVFVDLLLEEAQKN